MKSFEIKTRIFFGEQALDHLKELPYRKILIITDPFVVQSRMIDLITAPLIEAKIDYDIFKDVVPDPPIEKISEGVRKLLEYRPEAIVAVGGGSAIDSSKSIREFALKVDNYGEVGLIAIPTTSGTGSEVTSFAVVSDREAERKYPLVSESLTPEETILDAELVKSVPPAITADTGMDVLTHAIEAYVSTLNGPFTDPLALQAIEMVLDYLPASYNCNMEAREQMHYAQCLAGMAFSNALLGIVHSMAHKTGAAFSTGHIPHGCANAIYLPYVIKYNAKDPVAAKRYAEIARRMGLPGASEKALINSLVEKIDDFNVKLNIPKTLKDFGIEENEFKEKVAKIAELAVGDACTGSNPRAIDPATMEKLFTCTYYGTEVDF